MEGIPWLELFRTGGPIGTLALGFYVIWSRVDSLHAENVASIDNIQRKIDEDVGAMRDQLERHEDEDNKKFDQLYQQSRETHGAVREMQADVRNLTASINRVLSAPPAPRR